jgi:hypothetical protein
MQKLKNNHEIFGQRFLASILPAILIFLHAPACLATIGDNELNFKIYNPEAPQSDSNSPTSINDAASSSTKLNSQSSDPVDLRPEMPVSATKSTNQSASPGFGSTGLTNGRPSPEAASGNSSIAPSDINNLTKELPISDTTMAVPNGKQANTDGSAGDNQTSQGNSSSGEAATTSAPSDNVSSSTDTTGGAAAKSDSGNGTDSGKVLQGYVRVVPSGTKIPIIMDTAVDSDTSQEGDEFSARTSEDLTIDGTTVVPAGSIIKGRIATLNAPKHLDRNGSVALKFDTVTTPDNRQIPLVANLVARGGVVHAKRGMKDVAIDAGVFALPTAIGLGIGVIAGHSSTSSISTGGAALIGAGVGAAVGLAVLLAKKGKKVDVRPGDELKIELAEDLHMPTM